MKDTTQSQDLFRTSTQKKPDLQEQDNKIHVHQYDGTGLEEPVRKFTYFNL